MSQLERHAAALSGFEQPEVPDPPGLVVRGFIDDRPTVARWGPYGTDADPEVIRRAEVIAALGETAEVGGRCVHASLDADMAAAGLALIRALSRVTAVEFSVHSAALGAEQEDGQ